MASSLEPTNEQAIALAQATGLGETRGMHVAMLLWPLVRDMVLESAAKACEAQATIDGQVIPGLRNELDCAAAVRAMKGKP